LGLLLPLLPPLLLAAAAVTARSHSHTTGSSSAMAEWQNQIMAYGLRNSKTTVSCMRKPFTTNSTTDSAVSTQPSTRLDHMVVVDRSTHPPPPPSPTPIHPGEGTHIEEGEGE
jgi:hypothetical protein